MKDILGSPFVHGIVLVLLILTCYAVGTYTHDASAHSLGDVLVGALGGYMSGHVVANATK